MANSYLQLKSETPEINASILGYISDFAISNTFISGVVITIFIILLTLLFRSTYKDSKNVPNSLQAFLEIFYQFIYDFVNQMTRNDQNTKRIIGIIITLFLFIFLSNILTIIPPFSFLTFENYNKDSISMFRAHTSDFNTTFGIAASLVIVTHFIMIRGKGILNYIDTYIPLISVIKSIKNGPKAFLSNLAQYPINQFIGILDIIGELAKSLSISLRLFGNIFAGEVLTVIFFSLFAPLVPAIWWLMGLFTATIQTVVFASLIGSSYSSAMQSEETKEIDLNISLSN